MFRKQKKELNELTVLTELINKLEQKGDRPEYLIRNIELIGNIIKILQSFKNEMIDRLSKT